MNGQRRRPIAVDLFAGAGGLSVGFEQAGFDIVAAVEYDPIHAATHELNFPYSKVICRDARHVSGAEIRQLAGIGRRPIDVVIGGPPCQGFSLIGHRVLDDPRNNLVTHFLRLVDELRPRAFIMENVPGLASGAHHQLLDELVAGFENIDYRISDPEILNAAHFGVPQDRRRLFLLGARARVPLASHPKPITTKLLPGGGVPDSEPDLFLPPAPSVSDAILDLPDIEQFPELLESDVLEINLHGGSEYARCLRGDLRDATDFSYRRSVASNVLTGCLRAEHTEESRRRFAATPEGTTEAISRFYRLPSNGLCNTLRAGTATDRGAFSAPRPIHPMNPRCISVREAARLHSFPDWFRFHRTIWHGFRQIGNAVPPLLARAVAQQVMSALGEEPIRPREAFTLGSDRMAAFTMREAARHFGVSHTVVAPRKRASAAT